MTEQITPPEATPSFVELTPDQIEDVLARNEVGRLAYVGEDGNVAIEPLHYTFADGALYGRTSPGSKLRALWRRPQVAFEVDEIDGPLDWRSVVVRGPFHRVPLKQGEAARVRYAQALTRVRSRDAGALGAEDEVPRRTVLFRIPVAQATGRAASSGRPLPEAFVPSAPAASLPEPVEPSSGPVARLLRRLLGFDVFWKILLANAIVVAGAAAACALLTPADATPGARLLGMAPIFAGVVVVMLVLNGLTLNLALHPLRLLTDAAARVAEGDLDVRAPISPLADRQVARLTSTFNVMAEGVQRSRERLRAVATRTLSNAEHDRASVSRDLQDDAAQSLVNVLIQLKALRNAAPETQARLIDDARDGVAQTIERLRTSAARLRHPAMDMLGVAAAIEAYALQAGRTGGFRVEVARDPEEPELAVEARNALYRVAQEAIDNVVRHAAASLLRVRMVSRGPMLQLRLTDDGVGFSVDRASGSTPASIGLYGMQEMAAYFGGVVRFESEPGGGTTVEIEFPLNDATPATTNA